MRDTRNDGKSTPNMKEELVRLTNSKCSNQQKEITEGGYKEWAYEWQSVTLGRIKKYRNKSKKRLKQDLHATANMRLAKAEFGELAGVSCWGFSSKSNNYYLSVR